MQRILIIASLAWQVVQSQIQVIDNSGGNTVPYPYGIFPAQVNLSSPPPALVCLHGMESVWNNEGEIAEKLTWNGSGRRIKNYMTGNKTEAAVLVAEQFFSILPALKNDTSQKEQDWNSTAVYAVVQDALQRFPGQFDPSNITLCGYSAGARAIWDILTDPGAPSGVQFVRAAPAAGAADNKTWSALPNLPQPIQFWRGEHDFDGSSDLTACRDTLQHLGPERPRVSLQNVTAGDHNNMADLAFDVTMFRFLLGQSGPDGGSLTAANATSSTGGPSAPASQLLLAAPSATSSVKSSASRLRPRLFVW